MLKYRQLSYEIAFPFKGGDTIFYYIYLEVSLKKRPAGWLDLHRFIKKDNKAMNLEQLVMFVSHCQYNLDLNVKPLEKKLVCVLGW